MDRRLKAAARTLCLTIALCVSVAPALPAQGRADRSAGEREDRAETIPYAGPLALSGPVDEDTYIVGPGDRFAVTIWGQSVASHSAEVSPEGDLVLPGVATVPVAGLTLSRAKHDVAQSLGRVYRDVEISVSLVGLRKMIVNVLGAVADPGAYRCTALDPASELIEMAGGLLPVSSRRNITVTRRDGSSLRVDMARYEHAGDLRANPPVLSGDVILVPVATRFVTVRGAVAWPGRYELVEGETLGSLIETAGGFTEGAVTDAVEVRTYVDQDETTAAILDPGLSSDAALLMSEGDQVYVRRVSDWRPAEYVEVEGEVVHPGPYGIDENVTRLSDVLNRAGGPTEEASLDDAFVERPLGDDAIDAEYVRLDQMSVGDMTEAEYAYYKTIQRDRRSVVSDFEKALSGDPSEDVLLKDGDLIVVPRAVGTVRVIGQVSDPGEIDWEPGKRYGYYVDRAGGYSDRAHRGKTRVIRRATGEWAGARGAGELAPGDTVWVPERTDTDWWRVVREAAAFVTSVLTAYVIIDQVAN
jgi:protein involved in polysaccharide export with SLBB domain